MNTQLLISGCVGLAMCVSAFAQAGGGRPPAGGGNTGGPTGPTNPTNTRTPTTSPFPGNNPNQMPEPLERPIFLSGKVMMDDGTPPPDRVTIQLVCSANPRTVGDTDSKGRFNIDLANRNNLAAFADASQDDVFNNRGSMNGMGNTRNMGGLTSGRGGLSSLMGCELRANLPGFRSDSINLYNRREMDNPEVGTIVLHRMGNVEGLTISATTAMAPKDARKAFENGRNELKKQKFEKAQEQFQKAVDAYPKFAAAWFELGRTQEHANDLEGARKSYAQALAADARFVSPYEQLAGMAVREQKWQEVADDTSRLLKLNPVDFPLAWFYNSLANYQLQKLDAAEKSAREGLTIDSAHRLPKMNHLLGVILAQKQDFAGAAENMRTYLKLVPTASDADLVKKQLAEVEKFTEPQAKKE